MSPTVPQPPDVTLWHEEGSSRCERVLAILAQVRCEVTLFVPTKTPPTEAQLRELLAWLGKSPRAITNTTEPAFAELGLDRASDDAWIDALIAHPNLIRCPIAAVPDRNKAVVARPPQLVLTLVAPRLPAETNESDMIRRLLQTKPSGVPS